MRKVLLVLAGAAVLGACGSAGGETAAGSVQVATSFYPLEFVAEEVGGEHIRVLNLTPPESEPHDIELTPRQVGEISDSDLLLYIGQSFQPAIEDASGDVGRRAVDVLEDVELEAAEEHAEEEEHADEAEDEHGEFDPHVWLDPARTADIALAVADELSDIDPDNSADYRANAEDLAARLHALDEDFSNGLAECERREIVVSHDAFGYLAHKYDLEQVSISGLDPEAEPSPARAAEVADFAAENGVTTIFFETLVSPDIAETIAEEVGVRTEVLDPIEGPPEGTDYIGAMRANLDALRTALGCS